MEKRILIVGTVPYNKQSTSRAFESYFSGMKKENVAQIFSNTKRPAKGHCNSLYQITDQRMLKRWFSRRMKTGVVFYDEELPEAWTDNSLEVKSRLYEKLYSIGKRKTPLLYLFRGILWKRKYWCTDELNEWLESFKPECVFLSFSDDFFIPSIALYVAEKFNIPIVSSIGDDYYFNDRKSISPFYYIYRKKYKELIRKVFSHGGSAIYISDKIRDKYNSEFGLNGETVYLTSELHRRPFKVINKEEPKIAYFGNVGLGRYNSLNEIGYALGDISSEYKLDVYSNEVDKDIIRSFETNPYVDFHGSIPYMDVQKKIIESDIFIIVEGFKEEDINWTRYSLSTKAADGLASGVSIFVYGPEVSGVISYMLTTDSAMVCTEKEQLKESLKQLIEDKELQKRLYQNAIEVTDLHHNLKSSTSVFKKVVDNAVAYYER